MKEYIRLCRPRHYMKNILLFAPLVFGASLSSFWLVLLAFCGFSLLCSAVYVFNDLHDRKADANHPVKRNRPLASGTVTPAAAVRLMAGLLIVGGILTVFSCRLHPAALVIPVIYLVLNFFYTMRLKHVVLADVAVLAAGYFLRLFLGAQISGILISPWMYLVVLSISLFLGFGKRLGERRNTGTAARHSLEKYNDGFLEGCLNVFGATALVFYSLWASSAETMVLCGSYMLWSVPLAILIYLRYRWLLDNASGGDPVDVILGDIPLLLMGGLYGVYILLVNFGFLPPL